MTDTSIFSWGTPFLSRSLRTKYGSGYQLELFCEDGRSVSKTQDDVGCDDQGFCVLLSKGRRVGAEKNHRKFTQILQVISSIV